MKITEKQAKEVAKNLNVDLRKLKLQKWINALYIELEHGRENTFTNITNDNLIKTGKIVLAHITEYPNYYDYLILMEKQLKEFWKNKNKKSIYKTL